MMKMSFLDLLRRLFGSVESSTSKPVHPLRLDPEYRVGDVSRDDPELQRLLAFTARNEGSRREVLQEYIGLRKAVDQMGFDAVRLAAFANADSDYVCRAILLSCVSLDTSELRERTSERACKVFSEIFRELKPTHPLHREPQA